MLQVFFIRHAESEANANHDLICGRSDHIPLSPRGMQQAALLADRLQRENWQFDQLVSSVSLRARQTAAVVAEKMGWSEEDFSYSDQLVEISKGEWEGEVREAIYTPALREMLLTDSYTFRPPGGESQADVVQRMRTWLDLVEDSYNGQARRIAVFSHGFAIKSLLTSVLLAPPESIYAMITHNTSINGLKFDGQKWYVERLNDHSHLAGHAFVGHYW